MYQTDTSKLQYAKHYGERGWRIVPLRPKRKDPAINPAGFDRASSCPDQIEAWLTGAGADRNIGGYLPDGQLGLDWDDPTHIAALEDQLGPLPPTLTHRSGRAGGGCHMIYRLPAERADASIPAKVLPKVLDTRSGSNGYLVLPGSIHPDTGQPYTIQDDREVAELPIAWADWLVASGQRTAIRPEGQVTRRPTDDAIGRYNARTTVSDLLQPAGWTLVKGIGHHPGSEWRRPGKADGISGTVGSDGRFYNYSSSTPLPVCTPGAELNGCDPFDLLVYLQHDGDQTAALRAVGDADAADYWRQVDAMFADSPVLQHIEAVAKSFMASRMATLVISIGHAFMAVPPSVPFYSGFGNQRMALNHFVGLVGGPGDGKGTATSAGFACIDPRWGTVANRTQYTRANIGTGEGMAATFHDDRSPESKKPPKVIRPTVFEAQEIDTLSVLSERTGTTISADLRKAFSGETLGYQNKSDQISVPAFSYRLAFIAGIQPKQAEPLLSQHGGLPDRFVFTPVLDPAIAQLTRPAPMPQQPYQLIIPAVKDYHLPEFIVTDQFIRRKNRHSQALDTDADPALHTWMIHTQVAIGFALLESSVRGRIEVTREDWDRAALVLRGSELAKFQCTYAIEQKHRATQRARGRADALREEARDDALEQRTQQRLLKVLRRSHPQPVAQRDLTLALSRPQRPYRDSALAELISSGQVTKLDGIRSGNPAVDYALANPTSAPTKGE
ncbi:MAG: bifunctional DNA primase/polymerase [Mycobacterium sp.]|nr:MAG: bifunctional DNA primase/polymerase [Mycobacterium sp.]